MSTLSKEKIVEIASKVATANKVNYADIQTLPTTDSTGSPAIEIKFILTPGSSSAIMGLPSALTVSQIIKQLADEGEDRFPIVQYEE